MLRPLLSTWYACAQQMGDMELSVQLLIEMIGHGLFMQCYFTLEILTKSTGSEELEIGEEDLLAVLKVS